MSDLGVLSQQYQELTNLSRQLRHAAMQIHRAYHHIPGGEPNQPLDIVLRQLAEIACFLRDVVGLDDEGQWPEKWLAALPLPTFVVERLRDAHTHDLPLYSKQLTRLAEHLERGIPQLTDTDLDVLDGIILAVGADANAVFRRMMRWA